MQPGSAKHVLVLLGRLAIGLAGMLIVLGASSTADAAVTCTLSSATLTFGAVNPLSAPSSTSGSLTYTCSTTAGQNSTTYVCLSLGTGTGGTTPANRTLVAGTSRIPIQITGGSANPGQIGDGTSFPMAGPFVIIVPKNGSNTSSFPLAITMPMTTTAPAPGSYSSTFSGA